MARAVWKGPFVEESLMKKVDKYKTDPKKIPIKTMPEVFRYSVDKLDHIVDRALKLKIPMVAIFPQTNSGLKDFYGSEALNENNLVCKAIRKIKDKYKNEIGIMTDVALDPYTSHGHDGILRDKRILNDETIEILIQQSLLQAQMGSDVIAPSDICLLYTSPSPRDRQKSRMPSSA